MPESSSVVTIGVLALQGSFIEHVDLLKRVTLLDPTQSLEVIQVRTPAQLASVTALVIPGGESTAMSLIAQRTDMFEPLKEFVQRAKNSHEGYSVWGTCAGMILLGDQVIGGKLDGDGAKRLGGMEIKVVRNQWGRQGESFAYPLSIPALTSPEKPFNGIFIRAPVLHSILPHSPNEPAIEILASVPRSILPIPKVAHVSTEDSSLVPPPATTSIEGDVVMTEVHKTDGGPIMVATNGDPNAPTELGPNADIVMLRQGGLLVSSFHPELTGDIRVHEWWVREMCKRV